MNLPPLMELLNALTPAVLCAGDAVMDVYRSDFQVQAKGDESPVTAADVKAEALLVEAIERLGLGWPIVAEEAASRGEVPTVGPTFWLIDPLDGTKEFVARNGEFTLNVGLVCNGEPVLGLVLAPAQEVLYLGATGEGAWRVQAGQPQPLQARAAPSEGWTVLLSRSHRDGRLLDDQLARWPVAERRHVGSSLKLCLIAAGEADLYPKLGRTMEWDTAAGDAVLRAAGGLVRTWEGHALHYGKPGFENGPFLACGPGLNPSCPPGAGS